MHIRSYVNLTMDVPNATASRQFSNGRFAVQLAALTISEYGRNENFIIEPIGVVNHLCTLADTVDAGTRRRITELVDVDSASSTHATKKRNRLHQLVAAKEKLVNKIYISADRDGDRDLNEDVKTQLGKNLEVVDFKTSNQKRFKKMKKKLKPCFPAQVCREYGVPIGYLSVQTCVVQQRQSTRKMAPLLRQMLFISFHDGQGGAGRGILDGDGRFQIG